MKKIAKPALIGIMTMSLVVLTTGISLSISTVTIQGEVDAYGEFISDDGEVYEIIQNEKASELLENLEKRVEVKGSVTEDEESGILTMTVLSFRILPDEDESEDVEYEEGNSDGDESEDDESGEGVE